MTTERTRRDQQRSKKFIPAPRIRAKTPIGILKAVAKLILEEPRRYDQGDWIEIAQEPGDEVFTSRGHRIAPASCGTMACIGGWVVMGKRGTMGRNEVQGLQISERAQRILGLTNQEAYQLFSSGEVDGTPGTVTHARAGVEHIERFMREYLDYTGPSLLPARPKRKVR